MLNSGVAGWDYPSPTGHKRNNSRVGWVDYYIIELAPDYSYTMVGTPDRKYLWILSRSPQLDEEIYQHLIEKASSLGFDVSLLQKTIQAEQN